MLKNHDIQGIKSFLQAQSCENVPADDFSFSGSSGSKESACNVGNLGLIPGLGRSPGGGYGNRLQ